MYEAIEKILLRALEVAETTGEFVMEQAPLLLQEFYAWHTTKHIFLIILFALLSIVIMYFTNRALKTIKEDNGHYLDSPIPLFGHIISITLLVAMFINIYKLLYITIAPKLYLIDYFIGSNN